MTEKTREQRIEDAARRMSSQVTPNKWRDLTETGRLRWLGLAAEVLDAADAPRIPSWPTNQSVNAIDESFAPGDLAYERRRAVARRVLLADPIVQASVSACRKLYGSKEYPLPLSVLGRIFEAVRDAGLLEDEATG